MASPYVLLKTAAFTVLAPGTVAGLVPKLLARYDRESPALGSRPARALGRVALLSGLALYLHTAFRFSDEGEGTPAPSDEPRELVTGGVYRYSRNPMYVGVLLIIGGQAVRYRSIHVLWWAIVCWLGFHRRVVEYEEPHLAEKYGEPYEEYREAVPRWFPGPRPFDDR